jgi:hypothetical protein
MAIDEHNSVKSTSNSYQHPWRKSFSHIIHDSLAYITYSIQLFLAIFSMTKDDDSSKLCWFFWVITVEDDPFLCFQRCHRQSNQSIDAVRRGAEGGRGQVDAADTGRVVSAGAAPRWTRSSERSCIRTWCELELQGECRRWGSSCPLPRGCPCAENWSELIWSMLSSRNTSQALR